MGDELENEESKSLNVPKAVVQIIDLEDDEWLNYEQMFTAVEWKNDIPAKMEDLIETDQSTYEVVRCLKKQSEDPSQLNLVSIQSKDALIDALKKDPKFWKKYRHFVEVQLGIIEEDITSGATNTGGSPSIPEKDRTECCNCDCIL